MQINHENLLQILRSIMTPKYYYHFMINPGRYLSKDFINVIFNKIFNITTKKVSVEQRLKILDKSVSCLSVICERHMEPGLYVTSIQKEFALIKGTTGAELLKTLLDKYGSDKGYKNDYHLLYASLLNLVGFFGGGGNIFEIGLGSNYLDQVSNMGLSGKPGASLRAFRDFREDAIVYGADIDHRILFDEERIHTFQLDQTSIESWASLKSKLNGKKFSLIIDDGLHNSIANLTVILEGLELVEPGGFLVVEDINIHDLPFYKILQTFLRSQFNCKFMTSLTPTGCVFVAERHLG